MSFRPFSSSPFFKKNVLSRPKLSSSSSLISLSLPRSHTKTATAAAATSRAAAATEAAATSRAVAATRAAAATEAAAAAPTEASPLGTKGKTFESYLFNLFPFPFWPSYTFAPAFAAASPALPIDVAFCSIF